MKSKILAISILLISVSSILPWCSLPIGNTTVWWCIQFGILIFLYKLKPKGYKIWQINLFLIYLLLSAVYGAIYQIENYWDWKLLVSNFMIFSLPLASYTFSNPKLLITVLQKWFKYAPILLILLMPFLSSDAYGRFLVPYSFLALMFPLLNKKYKVLVGIAYILTITLGFESRSDMLKFTVCIILGLILIQRLFRKLHSLIAPLQITFLLVPFILFTLAASNIFNIFNIGENLGIKEKYTIKSSNSGETYSAFADTRTFLYMEEINSAIKHKYIVAGRSIARGYDSVAFGTWADEVMNIKRSERQSCETSILNVFNYFGMIGVIIYFLIFAGASYNAIYKSNNNYLPIIGLYVAFRWLFGWIEDFSRFDLNYLFLWIMIGICFSPQYRSMSNSEIKAWVKNIIK